MKNTPQDIPFETIKAFLFDLDGTLMDTDDQAVESLAEKLHFLPAERARKLARRAVMFGETPMNHVMTVIDMFNLDPLLFAARRKLKGNLTPTFRMIEGVPDMLVSLKTRARLAVVSTRGPGDAQAFLDQHNLNDYFELNVNQESTKRLKPHPEPVRFAAEHLGIKPEECVMVGDTPVDVLSARRAGAWSIAVLCGFGKEAELWRAGAHVVLERTPDILTLLK